MQRKKELRSVMSADKISDDICMGSPLIWMTPLRHLTGHTAKKIIPPPKKTNKQIHIKSIVHLISQKSNSSPEDEVILAISSLSHQHELFLRKHSRKPEFTR